MLAKTDWAHLIPHQGAMCLLDAVLAWDATSIHATSRGHASVDHPLRAQDRLHAVNLVECGAQAMAVHSALLTRDRGVLEPRRGRLVSVRDVTLTVEFVDELDGHLDVHVQCLYADDTGAQYAFRVEHRGHVLASGRAAVIHPVA
ncbi:phosphotransferase [Dyella halodurans]|uniref:Phosphotransferase n=1 Tax=Dyella halodurans TaxID=1920171 RepID=A0ABV9BZV6_9GAMM|nr:phosphotransferase [Dyella halodurans]